MGPFLRIKLEFENWFFQFPFFQIGKGKREV
jgi:hypothetical protein